MQKTSLSLAILTSILVIIFLIQPLTQVPVVEGQETTRISIVNSLGGTMTPASGAYNIEVGKTVHLRAVAGEGYIFWFWEVATPVGNFVYYDNPHNLTLQSGITYMIQAIYVPIDINITLPTPIPTTTPTPAVPELSWLVILPIFLSLLSIVFLFRKRNLSEGYD
jgi:hypothetical protein